MQVNLLFNFVFVPTKYFQSTIGVFGHVVLGAQLLFDMLNRILEIKVGAVMAVGIWQEVIQLAIGNDVVQYRTLPGFTKEGRCLVQRRYAPWPWARESLSPYSLDGRVEEPEDRYKVMDAVAAYARVWLELLKKAEPVKDPQYKQEMLARKKVLQKLYRDRDPGGEVIKKIFGEDKHHLFVSLIF